MYMYIQSTKFGESPSIFTQVIILKQKYGQTYLWHTYDRQMDGHMDSQFETIIPHH